MGDPQNLQSSNQKIKLLEKVQENITSLLEVVRKRERINRRWDLGFAITSVVFTLTITIVGILDEEFIQENPKRLITGILGGGLVAIQSITNSIPLRQRSGGYRVLEAQLSSLELDLIYKQYTDGKLEDGELKVILDSLNNLRQEAAKLENREKAQSISLISGPSPVKEEDSRELETSITESDVKEDN